MVFFPFGEGVGRFFAAKWWILCNYVKCVAEKLSSLKFAPSLLYHIFTLENQQKSKCICQKGKKTRTKIIMYLSKPKYLDSSAPLILRH